VISVLPAAQPRTGLLGLEQDNLSSEDEECCGTQSRVKVPENLDTIHSMTLDDRKISSEKIAETLTIFQEKVRYIINEILDMRKPNGFLNVIMLVKSMIECLLHKPILTDFGGILCDFLTVL
jgi:hypothetical protein